MMSLQEAIKQEKRLAELSYRRADSYHTDENVYMTQEALCRENAEHHEQIAEWLEELQEPKKGHWIRGKERHFLDTRTNLNVEMKEATGKGYHTYINAQCSKCRMITIHDDSILYQYCPHCGAKMQAESEV